MTLETVEKHVFSHIRSVGGEKRELEKNPEFRAKSWVVAAFRSWLKRFRKICPRYEKNSQFLLRLLAPASGMIVFNRVKGRQYLYLIFPLVFILG